MSAPCAALQRATASRLLAAAPVTALVADRVRDELDGTGSLTSPYVELGAIQVIDDSNACSAGWEMVSTLDVWANGPKAKLVAMEVAGAVTDALPGLTIAGYQVNDDPEIETLFRADASASAHGIITVTWQVSPA